MAESNNILFVYSNPKSPERDEEYNTWFNHFHLQQILKVPGFLAATRYKLSHTQLEWMPPMGQNPAWPHERDRYLSIYEIDRAADPRDLFRALRDTERERVSKDPANDPVEWGGQWFFEAFTHPETSIAFKPPSTRPADAGPCPIWVVTSSPAADEVEDENNRWYTTQVNLRYPGFKSVARFKLSRTQGTIDPRAPQPQGEWPYGRHSYLALWEFDDLIQGTYYRRRAQETGTAMSRYAWTPPLNRLRRADDHIIYDPVTTRVTPIWPRPRE